MQVQWKCLLKMWNQINYIFIALLLYIFIFFIAFLAFHLRYNIFRKQKKKKSYIPKSTLSWLVILSTINHKTELFPLTLIWFIANFQTMKFSLLFNNYRRLDCSCGVQFMVCGRLVSENWLIVKGFRQCDKNCGRIFVSIIWQRVYRIRV